MKIAVCAGEKSGDLLGYNLLKELKRDNDSISFIGVGGSLMESAGLKSFFPLKEISYMGLIDPLLNLKKILKKDIYEDPVYKELLHKLHLIPQKLKLKKKFCQVDLYLYVFLSTKYTHQH